MTSSARWLVPFGIAAVLAPACGDDADPAASTSTTGGGAAGGGGTPTFAESPCGSCLAMECATFDATCRSEPACAAYLDCVGACPTTLSGELDPACEAACPAPSGAAAADALANWSTCASGLAGCVACGHTPAQPNPFAGQVCSDSTDPDACYACWKENCCETGAQCFDVNPECEDLYSCTTSCAVGSPDGNACYAECFALHPDGVQDFLTDFACTAVECVPCDGAEDVCGACVQEHCGASIATCLQSEPCFFAAACVIDCAESDTACLDACVADLGPQDLSAYEAWRICAIQECSAECDND